MGTGTAVLRKLTVLCVISALAGFVLLGVSAVQDGKREWQHYQAAYKKLLLEKISRDKNPVLYDHVAAMKPEIKQIIVEDWKAVDRCTTCHVGIEDPSFANAAPPFRTHPNNLLKSHPVEKFGCTICHGGQGWATTYEGAAHRDIHHWADPMVEKGLMQSRCGLCHRNFAAIGANRLIEGRELFKRMHCAGCHKIDSIGGDVGPVLSGFGDKDPGNFTYANLAGPKTKQNWVKEHFRNPQRVTPDSPMRPYPMTDDEIESLSSYVLSLSQRAFAKVYTPKEAPEAVAGTLEKVAKASE